MVYKIEGNIDSCVIDGNDDNEVEKLYPNAFIKLINKREELKGVCFNYALDDDSLDSCEESYNILKENYKQIPIEQAQKGDVISYHKLSQHRSKPTDWNSVHFGIIDKTNGTLKSTIIKSKWGKMGVFESSINDVFDFYGNAILIWRKKKGI